MSSGLNRNLKKYIKLYKTKKGDRWAICLPDGRCGQIRERGFISYSDALTHANSVFLRLLSRTNTSPHKELSKITFLEYSKLWIDFKERNGLVAITIRRYKDQLEQFIIPFFGSFKLMELEKYHLRNYIQDLQKENVSTYNVNSTVTLFKMVIRQAIEDDYMSLTNLLTVKTPKHKPKDPRFWDQTETQIFLNASVNSKHHKFWKFVLFSGLRAGEVAALQWDCVHFDRKSGDHVGFIEVKRTCAQKTRVISETTKNGDRRLVPIFPQIFDMLKELKENSNGPFVFGGHEPRETSHFNRLLQQDLKSFSTPIKRINFHGLRHTFCSYIDSTGMNRRIVSEIMGHRDLATTNRYSHVSNQTLGSEVSKWCEKQSQQRLSNISLVAL